eukprot:gene8150-8343_t
MDLGKLVQWIPASGKLHDLEVLRMEPSWTWNLPRDVPLHMGHLTALTAIRSLPCYMDLGRDKMLPPVRQEVAVRGTILQHLRDLNLDLKAADSLKLQQLSSSFTEETKLKLSVPYTFVTELAPCDSGGSACHSVVSP